MATPKGYEWLNNTAGLPRTIVEGLKLFGTREIVGRGSNRTIMEWRDELNAAAGVNPLAKKIVGYGDDDIAWCGLFAAIVAFRAGKEVVENPLWARNWANFGQMIAYNVGTTAIPKLQFEAGKVASLGDCLVFVRNGGGHVGWYIGEDGTAYHVLGGNQSNAVTITRVEKARCIAIRRPEYNSAPASVKAYKLAARGGLSRNEA
ncbi:MAG: TIGR02594 family protein [Ahrensia sp.]|nr:TIGR02594 family protein [Ahrensia sp.]